MKEYLVIFLLIYGFVTVLLILVGFFRSLKKEARPVNDPILLDEIIVIIPLRNELNRINGLVESLRNSVYLPKEIVFVDDHSTDATSEYLKNNLQGLDMRVLSLPEGRNGKKEALRFGIEQTQSKYILTMDADVRFEATYFEYISSLEHADMYVLPAVLVANTLVQRLYEIDTILVNALNVATAGWRRPIFASGANLLYHRACYDEVEDYASHQHMASGDDTYLLRDFRNANKDIRVVSGKSNGIVTETPQSLKEFFDQRVRWAGKSGDMNDTLANALAILQFVLALGFIVGMILLILSNHWRGVIALFTAKLIIDLVAYSPYFQRIGRLTTLLFLPIYELLFPFYFAIMLLLIGSYSPKWKDRPLKH